MSGQKVTTEGPIPSGDAVKPKPLAIPKAEPTPAQKLAVTETPITPILVLALVISIIINILLAIYAIVWA